MPVTDRRELQMSKAVLGSGNASDRTFVLGPCLDRLVRDSYGDSIESREIDRQ